MKTVPFRRPSFPLVELAVLSVTVTVATGGIAGVAISGALIGAGIGIGVAGISDCVSNGGITKTTKDYLAYGLGGAVAGAVAGVGGVAIASKATLKTAVAVGATSSMAGDATTQFVGTGAVNPLQTIKAGVAGAVTAGAFYGGAKAIGSVKSAKLSKIKGPDGGDNIIKYGPMNKGPLADEIANTFRSGTYTKITIQEETTFYRAYGGKAEEIGSYWTRTKPQGPLQSMIDSALDPKWGNTATNVSTIKVPKGTTIFEGFASQQGGLLGGGNQVYIEKVDASWLMK